MRYSSFPLRATLAACTLAAFALPSFAQTDDAAGVTPTAIAKQQRAELAKGDPKRWDRAPGSERARLNIQKQEIAAAYAEAKTACQKMGAADRSQCLKDARQTYQEDLRNARQLVAASPSSELQERVTPLESGVSSPQMGTSGAGATGSGTGQATQSEESEIETEDSRRREDEPLPEERY